MDNYTEVLFDELSGAQGNIGIITLNRPEVLNALNQTMVHAISRRLQAWKTAPDIKAVVIRAAEGRAFCAGGDLRLIHDRSTTKDPAMAHFFRDEYHLNRAIFHFQKPYIAFLNGVTMGGGVGLSIHGSHRVATEKLLFAMPETGIGFFPDVGGTYFLPRLRARLGFYLGLTGAKLGSDDSVAIGIAQQKVASDALPELLNALAKTAFEDDALGTVTQVINQFKSQVTASPLLSHEAEIETCFANQTMESIIAALQASQQVFCQEMVNVLAKKSPTSLKVTLRALQEGREMDFDACMQQEYRLVNHFLLGHDFPEGIRAVIVDKDQKPHWQPAKLSEVTKAEVDEYFTPIAQELTQ